MDKSRNYIDTGIDLLKEIPSDWQLQKIKYFATIYNGDSLNEDFKSQFETENKEDLAYISSKDIHLETSEINYQNGLRIPRDYGKFKIANKHCPLLCIEGGSAGRKIGFTAEDVYFVNKLACFKAADFYTSKFIYYSLRSDLFQAQFLNSMTGMIGGVSISSIKNFYLSLPPRHELIKLVSFLDQKFALFNEVIERKLKVIELLKEKRKSTIHQQLTKGLNLNVEFKDSQVKWIGMIPAHWDVARVGHYAKVVRGASPRPAGDPLLFGGDFMPWITVAEVTNSIGKYILSTESFLTEEGSKQSRIVEPETLLLSNSGATLGVPKISKITGCINDGSVAFPAFSNKLDRDYLYYFFSTHTDIYRSEVSGYGQPNLNTDIIKSTKIPLPPIEEQKQVVLSIDAVVEKFDEAISIAEKQIELLYNYRQSLISEAVTGKIDLREWEPKKTNLELA